MASLVLGLLGFTCCLGALSGIPAIIFGAVAIRDVRRSAGRLTGGRLASAGILLGIIALWMTPLWVRNFREAQVRAKVSRARSAMRSLATAIDAYYVDHRVYPAWGISDTGLGVRQTHNGSVAASQGRTTAPPELPFFLLDGSGQKHAFHTITSPVAYVETFPMDPFAPLEGATFVYWSVFPNQADPSGNLVGEDSPVSGFGWVLLSAGPDGNYDIAGEWDVYDPGQPQPSARLLGGTNSNGSAFTYDPTNGTTSDGDIWHVKM